MTRRFPMGSARLVTAVRKNSVGLGEREREGRRRLAPRSRGLASEVMEGRCSSHSPDVGAEAQAVAPRPE